MLNSEKAILAMNDVDDSYLECARKMLGYKAEVKIRNTIKRRILTIALAATLILSLGIAAYAANLFGLRELFATSTRGEMPEEAAELIIPQGGELESDGWRAQVMESYCDETTVLITIRISADARYLVAPTDEDTNSSLSVIGLSGEGTLGEYARQEGKTLLFVGADLDHETLGLISGGQRFENVSPQEMTIYFEGARSGEITAPTETNCTVVTLVWPPEADAQDTDSYAIERHTLPVTLAEADKSSQELFTPADPYAVPGYKLGELNLTQTPLGISLRLKMNVLDQKEAEKLLTLHLEGVEFHGAGSIDPNGYALFSQGQGQFGDIPTIRFLDWDKNTIAEASFERVD